MLEARLHPASILKKLLDSIKDLVNDVNFDCNESGISLQAMDSAHVSLISLLLRDSGFQHYRCDRNINLGISLTNLTKIIKAAGPEDEITLQAGERADSLTLVFTNESI
jgi:proliferating cell nuclear antigen